MLLPIAALTHHSSIVMHLQPHALIHPPAALLCVVASTAAVLATLALSLPDAWQSPAISTDASSPISTSPSSSSSESHPLCAHVRQKTGPPCLSRQREASPGILSQERHPLESLLIILSPLPRVNRVNGTASPPRFLAAMCGGQSPPICKCSRFGDQVRDPLAVAAPQRTSPCRSCPAFAPLRRACSRERMSP